MGDRTGTREKILIAAATMLAEDPTATLSVRGVARRAGVSTGSLRHFFPSQRELIDAVIAGIHTVELADDPIRDTALSPTERLVACLHLLLSAVGTGDRARAYVHALHDAYVESPPSEDAAHTFLALERDAVHRIERWLSVLRDERATATDDLAAAARFLSTVVNGLVFERALPGDRARLALEANTLGIAVAAVVVGGDGS